MTPQCLDLIGCLFAIGIIFLAEKSLLHILNQKWIHSPLWQPSTCSFSKVVSFSCVCLRMRCVAELQGWAMSYECFLPVAGGWLTLFLSPSSADASWQQEVLPFQPALNESKPAWGWEDEQGFSALRHSGRTTAPRAPTCSHIPPTEMSHTSMQQLH